MRIDIMTAIPSLLVSPFNDSIIKRAYRSYKLEKATSLKAADIRENLLG